MAGKDGDAPVVLLHGFPESSWSFRKQFAPLSAAGFRVVAPDLRGAGKSDIRPPYDLDALAEDLYALIGVLFEGKKVRLVGHDWGGATAWTFARRHPELVERLAVINSCLPERQIEALSTDFDVRQFLRSFYVFLFQIPKLPEWLLALHGAALVRFIIRQGMKNARGATNQALAPFCAAATRPGGAAGMLGPYRAVLRRALLDLIRDGDPFPDKPIVSNRTLLLWGDADPAQGLELIAGMQDVVPDLRIVHFPRCGHFPHSEMPEAVNDALLAFLTEP